MREGTCGHCENEWYIKDGEVEIKQCPHCGKPIQTQAGQSGTGEIDTLAKAIYQAIALHGIEILSNARRMRGVLMDLVRVPEVKSEVRIFFKLFDQRHLSMYAKTFSMELPEAKLELAKICCLLTEEEWLEKRRAEWLMESCLTAIRYYKGIAQPNAEEMYAKGLFYHRGGVAGQDDAKAVECFRAAAEQGYALAQRRLGVCYEKGLGIGQDTEQAMEWYQKAAEQGDIVAQFNLINSYFWGIGVPQDIEKAVAWGRRAADQGDAFSQYFLGTCYLGGIGVIQDIEKAVEWYQKAAEQGDAAAQEKLNELSSKRQ